MSALVQHPTISLAAASASALFAAVILLALAPFAALVLSPFGAQALMFAFIIAAIGSAIGSSLSAVLA
jgi:hypothetical protein